MIYEQHFALERAPFSMLPDPEFLYLGKQHSSAKAFLESSALVRDSFVVITGAIGAGKTTLVEGYLAELSQADTIIARINQTQISPTGFLRLLLDELGLRAFKSKKPELLSRFRKYLARAADEGKRLVLVIDEAQNLSHEVLEEVRMLTGGPQASALSIVLVGQPEFLDTLETPALMQLAQRCRLRSHIEALPKSECSDYIDHRIAVAGGDPDRLFTASARTAVYTATNGVPRLINNLCDTALICAFADGRKTVTRNVVDAALRELNWQKPAASRRATRVDKPSADGYETGGTSGEPDAQDTGRHRRAEADQELQAALAEIEALRAELSERSAQENDLANSNARLDELQAAIDELSAADALVDDYLQLSNEIAELSGAVATVDAKVAESEALFESVSSGMAHDGAAEAQLTEQEGELARLRAAGQEQAALIDTLQAAADEHSETATLATELQQTIDRHSAANEELAKENQRLQAELADQQAQQETLSAQLGSASDEQDKLSASLSEYAASLLGRDNSIDTLKAEVRSKSKLIDELHDRLASMQGLEDGTADLASRCDQLVGQLKSEQDSNEQYEARISELEQLLSARDDDALSSARAGENLGAQLAELSEQREALAEELRTEREDGARNAALLKELEKSHASQLQTISDLELANGSQASQLSEYERHTESLNEQLRLSTDAGARDAARVASLEKDAEEQTRKISELEKKLEQVGDEAAEGARKIEDISATLAASTEEKQQLIASAEDLTEKIAARDNTIGTQEAELRRKSLLIDELHDKLAPLPALQAQVETLDTQNAELSHELETRNERIFELQEALSLGQQRLDEARREMDEAHGGQVKLHMEVSELKSRLSALKDETKSRDDLVTSLQTECQNRKSDLRKLRKELDESMDQSRELQDSLELGEQRVVDLERQLEAALETISEMGEASARVNSDMQTYEREVNEQREKLASLNNELTARNSELQSLEANLKHTTETIKVLELDAEAGSEARVAEAASMSELQALEAQLRAEVEARDERIEELLGSQEQSEELANKLRDQINEQSALVQELDMELAKSGKPINGVQDTEREFNETAVLTDENMPEEEVTASQKALEAGLIITANGHPARRVNLSHERMIIGRTGDSDIKIDNEFASRHHAQIVLRNGRYILEDLNSTNGIFVNSRRVTKRQLRNRDVIRIGKDKMIFVLEQHTSH